VASRSRRDLPERQLTLREALRRVLSEGRFTAHELSGRVGISEKDVAGHLEHLARSVKGSGDRFDVEPARCQDCGFVFRDRTRLTRPSRCPRCKSERLAPARYGIVTRGRTAP
jgi:transcriptional regulator